ncbi:undecaprenyldiphospho-muramoylpentapeptide beta-N-acetylglucosaminyltransferase [Streptobacillus moniliformis]|uniref:undecaprenyldiphospho-muramoylpentapeptide beta-N-acetylglucosaminyltransferase n=1 Tax=Streptobacillus moniliformis TaxID=34105 RepID=UPI0007E431BF|nr:undecaprenyldiphospho-muramoylpentapeptide beta-N-acetylglucosaminyltransferase [Streptobacillus moniliformis]
MSKILITTGGTGGHIYPALALAEKLKEQGHELIFMGTCHRMEKEIVPSRGYKFYGLDILPLKSIIGIAKLFKGIYDARKILKDEKIDYVIGFGNYISLPALLAAKTLKLDIYLQEQNVTMGQANKWMYPYAKNVFIAFSETLKSVKNNHKEKFVVTGNPIRPEFYNLSKEEVREKMGIAKDAKVITVMGGSLGAKNINDALIKKFEDIKNSKVIFYWATGKDLYKDITSKIEENENTIVVPYFEEAYNVMAASDILLCRAGASTISELIELEKPAILIPYNFVGQKENAEILEAINSAKIYSNEEVEIAIDEAIRLVNNEDKLKYMKDNISKINPGNAVENIIKYFEV